MNGWFDRHRIYVATGLIFLIVAAYSCPALAADAKRVMLLHSFGRDVKPWSDYAQSIRSELQSQSPWPLDITEHSLISARSGDQDSETPFVDYLRALFAKRPPDLIVSIGAPAADFVQRHRPDFLTNTPMVLTGVEQRRVRYSLLTANDAVVPLRIDYAAAMKNILRVLPDTKNVMVVIGTSPIETFWEEEIRKEVAPFTDRLAFTFSDEWSFEELLKRAAALPPHSAIFWELMIVDAAGVIHDGDTAFKLLHSVANAPLFGYYEPNLGEGLVGGPYAAVLDTTRRTAAVTVRILGGEKPGGIRMTPVEFAAPRFDWREMQRWGISKSRLPPGSTIDFRSPTPWEQYRRLIVTISVVVLLQAALISLLLFERRRRRQAEIDARQRLSELAHLNRYATAGELSASIAHELNQSLGAILNNAETMAIILKSPSPNLEEIETIANEIERDDKRAAEVISGLRRLLMKAAFVAQDVDLNRTVREVLEFLSMHAVALDVALRGNLAPQALRVSGDPIQLQQVVLNLVVNAMDSVSGAPNGRREVVGRTWLLDGASAMISIADSGPGISSDKLRQVFEPFFTTKENGMGMGLSISRRIIEAHGGRIWAENQTGGGAIFCVSLPLASCTEGRAHAYRCSYS